MRGFIACFAAALPAFACAVQPAPIDVKTVSFNGSLPYVVSGNPRRDARINHSIFFGMAGQPAPAKYTDPVNMPEGQDGPPPTSGINYSITRSDSRVLAFEIEYEGCGAYCEHNRDQYNFDAVSGRPFTSSDIFTPQGRAALFKLNNAKRLDEYRKVIASLKNLALAKLKKQRTATPWPKPKTAAEDADEDSRITESIDMYQYCVDSMSAPDYASYYTKEAFPIKIEDTNVTFLFGRCSNHAMHALDEVGDQAISYKVAELAPHLTPYGKYLLAGGPQVARPAEPYQQFLFGRVGQAAIAFDLSRPGPDGTVTGSYFYNKYRKPIGLSGKVNGNTIELTETESTDTPKPLIRATISGDKLEGQWIGKQTLDFSVAP